jgi:2-(1,2-epoxy-1,2-dihydrophenyl)acetyl-CoA isomerase
VVAAVHGWVVGAGLELMLNADLAIAARSARFALPEAALGLLGTGGVGALLPRAVGLPRAKGLLMLGTEFTAADAERCGLLWAVVDDAELPAQALAVAQQLAGRDAKVLAEIKATLHHETLGDVPALLAREAATHQRLDPPQQGDPT